MRACDNQHVTVTFSISLSQDIAQFLENRVEKGLGSCSEVVEQALRLLQDKELEQAYEAAGQEWLENEDAELWEAASADGLT